eukprot:TRINITY_DN94043_c0_g1_i1.p1 TRINITY_DN94043_c0_g1~~TRINITY_DN94043_c0_g1_i1.p1  ORF type:complete len:387 (-),score=64.21 TRINITY_DN94043_c0_g1_i1:38-1198(-)
MPFELPNLRRSSRLMAAASVAVKSEVGIPGPPLKLRRKPLSERARRCKTQKSLAPRKPRRTVARFNSHRLGNEPLRALSVRQPHAFAIMCGEKQIENRTWRPKLKLPAYIALHASGASSSKSLEEETVVYKRLAEAGVKLPDKASLPLGSLLGIACIDACLPPLDHNQGWALAGHYRWSISKVLPLPDAIPCPGQLGLWKVPAGCASQALQSLLAKARGAAAHTGSYKTGKVKVCHQKHKASAVTQQRSVQAATRCRLCQGPSSHIGALGPKSEPLCCEVCAKKISKQRALKFVTAQPVWCRGFGPMWPAFIKEIGFTARDDPQPYFVEFFGDHKHAWVSEERLLPLEARNLKASDCRQKPTLRRRLELAMAEAESALAARGTDVN